MADECRHPTIDLPKKLRVRRLRWTGHVLRLEETHLVRRTLLARAEKISGGSYPAGFVLAEAPAHASTDELLQLAADRDGWHHEVLRIADRPVPACSLCAKIAVWQKIKLQ